MTYGVVSKYARHEATYMALQVIEYLQRRGEEVSLFGVNHICSKVHPEWDDKVVTQEVFSEWARTKEVLIWTDVPSAAQVEWLHSEGILVAVVLRWETLRPDDLGALCHSDVVFCPSFSSFSLLKRWGVRNAVLLSWAGEGPLYKKSEDYVIDSPRLLLPLWDGNVRRTEVTVLDILSRTLAGHSTATATIAYSTSTMRPVGSRKIKEMQQRFGSRVNVQKGTPPWMRPVLFQQHDLTIWPSHFDSSGLVGLTSLTAGTPVLGFDCPSMNEVLREDYSMMCPCNMIQYNDLGVPIADPDYYQFDDMLYNIVADKEYLQTLQQNTLSEQLARKTCFAEQLGLALSLATC